ncbi:MAG TPA: DUF805 domain-containing protein [Gammaproteobacteria bacterium]|nr:DUF805 domain-containing protein [Gammaproteobacteria bacterium]
MENRNPYASPRAKVADADGDQDYGEIRIFSAQGRLGRVRYIGYMAGMALLIAMVGGGLAVAALLVEQVAVAIGIGVVAYVTYFVVRFLLTIQRAHDFNQTGWLSVLLLLPLVPLIFWFIPGSKDENEYGKRPPPNTAGVIVLACLMPIFFFGGILAAVAIPAYQDYAERARQVQSEQ